MRNGMTKTEIGIWTMAVAVLATLAANGGALAQPFPNRPVRLVVPFPTGGGSDTSARALSDLLAQGLGQPVVVENRPGGGTILATEHVAKSAPDGHTLLLAPGDIMAIDLAFGNRLPYDVLRDFNYISGLSRLSIMLVASPSAGFRSVQELVARAKANPGKLTFASLGASSPHYLFFEWFKNQAGVSITEIPYKGTMQGVTDMMAGRVDLVFFAETNAMRFAAAGKLVTIATTAERRSPFAEGVPSFAESGFPELVMYNWFAIAAPAGLPRDILRRLNADIGKALTQPVFAQRLAGAGLTPWPTSPEKPVEVLREDTERYRRIIQMTGIKPEGR